ncbi:exodeoxyribonuclease VII small subunit [Atopobacter sp. AH10]|uniref:exodeoxyribonuclease VII small subunit n=1 Tax=Atopobacter sp. AH10 TaxID=2315861 RepID=UPI000EF209CD|nr:exodeoxyribonuclease VII small subunit [Atopobacter sp. AH10]RLK62527.1 exodeoxyribonuclease VII small subunit [Atopobacter sp. AH10]
MTNDQTKEKSSSTSFVKPESFEEGMKELQDKVTALESGQLSLNESLQYYQRGMELSQYLAKELKEAEKTVTRVMKGQSNESEEARDE